MSKHTKPPKDDAKKADEAATPPSNTTSGGERPGPTAGPATVEGDAPEGAAHYPPGPSDQAGEKTDNVPPSKRLPPDVPPEEQVDLTRAHEAQLTAMATALRSLGIDPAPICEEAVAKLTGATVAKADGPTRTAVVTPKGGGPVAVEYPADAKDRHAAAVEAYKQKCGVWALPEQPHVEFRGE